MTLVPLPGENFSAKCAESPRPSKRVVGKKRHHPNRKHKGKKVKRNGMNRHHQKNKCRGGQDTTENLLWMYIEKHNEFHKIFQNSDPEYIILVLDRMMKMKGYERFRNVVVTQGEL